MHPCWLASRMDAKELLPQSSSSPEREREPRSSSFEREPQSPHRKVSAAAVHTLAELSRRAIGKLERGSTAVSFNESNIGSLLASTSFSARAKLWTPVTLMGLNSFAVCLLGLLTFPGGGENLASGHAYFHETMNWFFIVLACQSLNLSSLILNSLAQTEFLMRYTEDLSESPYLITASSRFTIREKVAGVILCTYEAFLLWWLFDIEALYGQDSNTISESVSIVFNSIAFLGAARQMKIEIIRRERDGAAEYLQQLITQLGKIQAVQLLTVICMPAPESHLHPFERSIAVVAHSEHRVPALAVQISYYFWWAVPPPCPMCLMCRFPSTHPVLATRTMKLGTASPLNATRAKRSPQMLRGKLWRAVPVPAVSTSSFSSC